MFRYAIVVQGQFKVPPAEATERRFDALQVPAASDRLKLANARPIHLSVCMLVIMAWMSWKEEDWEGQGEHPNETGLWRRQLASDLDRAVTWGQILTLVEEHCIAGNASALYLIVHHLTRACVTKQNKLPWQLLVIVARLEIHRLKTANRHLPEELKDAYPQDVDQLAYECWKLMLVERSDDQLYRGGLALLSASKGFFVYSLAILEYAEPELGEFLLQDGLSE